LKVEAMKEVVKSSILSHYVQLQTIF